MSFRKTILAALLLGSLLPASATSLEIIRSGERHWDLLLEDIAGARQCIDLDYYKLGDDASGRLICTALEAKAREGVTVRLVIENVNNGLMRKDFFREMTDAGIEIRYFTRFDRHLWEIVPEMNHHDHRKIVVIDGRIGYLGGMNLKDHYHYDWKDTHLRIEGPAAAQLDRVFFADWHRLGGSGEPLSVYPETEADNVEIVSGSPNYPVFLNRYVQLLGAASSYAYFQTPYLCPPEPLLKALKEAAARGVDVRIIVPQATDHAVTTHLNQSFFQELLESGVRIYEYLPCFNHSKTLVCDDRWCWIGSVNLNHRSLYDDYEVAACIDDPQTARSQKEAILKLLEDTHEVTLEEVQAWSAGKRFFNRVPRILKKQL